MPVRCGALRHSARNGVGGGVSGAAAVSLVGRMVLASRRTGGGADQCSACWVGALRTCMSDVNDASAINADCSRLRRLAMTFSFSAY